MARLRSSKYLSCFYCGRRSEIERITGTREFLCLYCDATNYLDENGEITDPPVATEREATPTSFVLPQTSSSPSDSIFCATCLHNQHLFTRSLAQYFPDDPDDPEYEKLEREYYRFRRGLEQRYPQVCEDCATRVDKQIRQSGYAARTDHLRRAMERTRKRRAAPKTTALDWIHSLGQWAWWGGLVAQMLWHLVVVSQILQHDDTGMYDPDDKSRTAVAVAFLNRAVAYLPPTDSLIRWSIIAGISSAWWNPHFVQVNRGFTRHLLGFTQWYSFQGLIVFFRFMFRSLLNMEGGRAQSRNAQLAAHLVMAAVMSLIYLLAGRSITVDTTPLFGVEGTVSPTQSPKPSKSPAQRKYENSKTFSELFSEALDETPRRALNPSPPSLSPIDPIRSRTTPQAAFTDFAAAKNTPQRVQEVQYSDEMDWSPIQPVPRALAGDPNAKTRPFGQAPTREHSDPFWFKVPAAPVNPAQRLRNPQMPALMQQPIQKKESPLFKANAHKYTEARRASGEVDFKQPSFFPQEDNDDASVLADMLGHGFTLSQEREQQKHEHGRQASPSKPAMWRVKGGNAAESTEQAGATSIAAPAILAVAWAVWLTTTFVSIPYGTEVQLFVLAVAGTIALVGTGNSGQGVDETRAPSLATYVFSILSVVELAAVCWVAWEVHSAQSDVDFYGAGVLGVVLAHQVWNTFA